MCVGVLMVVVPMSRGTGDTDMNTDALGKPAMLVSWELQQREPWGLGHGCRALRHCCLTQLGALC